MQNKIIFILCLLASEFAACKQNSPIPALNEPPTVTVPNFDADSAYRYTAVQVAFGPRVPNTEAHKQCGNYLANELRRFGAQVVEQPVTVYTYDNKALNAKNIIGSFLPDNGNRILLCAHWDSRPFADHDPNPANHHKPIDAANDGAGACGILLEIARQINQQPIAVGIDIVFFDAEDWGAPEFDANANGGWCLGSEYWAKNPHVRNYKARFGILLDMASAKNAQFYREGFSMSIAKPIVDKVWKAAEVAGYGAFFIDNAGEAVQDDHVEVYKYLRIPCIDIIHYDARTSSGFGAYWHTLDDNMDSVGKETMKAVGQTILQTLYNEK